MRRILIVAGAAALACAPPAPPSDFALKIGVVGPLAPASPKSASGASALVGDLLYEPLASPRPGGFTSRYLRSWERTGARSWRIEPLPGARFSDGSAVGADDVAVALRGEGMEVRALGSGALEVVSPAGGRPLEVALSMTVVARKAADGWLGTGAFAVESQDPQQVVLRRVEPAPGAIARVEFHGFSDARQAFAGLLRGEVSAMVPVDRALAELLDGVPGLRVVRGASPSAVAVRFGPRLSPSERRALAAALPVPEIAAAVRREVCCAEPPPPRPDIPAGRRLSIAFPGRYVTAFRAALALRQALGPRGGEIEAVEAGAFPGRAQEFDLVVVTMLVRPPGVGAIYFQADGIYNWSRYRNPDYEAALAAGDEGAAEEALRLDPPAVVIARLERLAAVDARLSDAALGDWGVLDLLPGWKVDR